MFPYLAYFCFIMVFYQAFCGVLPRHICFLVHHSLSAIVCTYRFPSIPSFRGLSIYTICFYFSILLLHHGFLSGILLSVTSAYLLSSPPLANHTPPRTQRLRFLVRCRATHQKEVARSLVGIVYC